MPAESPPSDPGLPLAPMAWSLGAWALAMLIPPLAWQHRGWWLNDTYGQDYLPFELMGISLSVAVLGLLLAWWRRAASPRGPEALAPMFLFMVVLLHYVQIITEYSQPSWDWKCYLKAAMAWSQGGDPFGGCYIYPPLFAQVLAGIHQMLSSVGPRCGMELPTWWGVVFYTFQGAQVLFLAAVLLLSYRLAMRLGMAAVPASFGLGALFTLNNPLLRTLRHDQPNLLVLALVLASMDLLRRRPAAAGLLLALAAHMKVLPLVLLWPWLVGRRWRAMSYCGLGLLLLALPASDWGRQPELLLAWIPAANLVAFGEYFRDNGVFAVTMNLLRAPWLLVGSEAGLPLDTLKLCGRVMALLAAFLLMWRIFRRGLRAGPDWMDGASAEALAMWLLAAPVVWEHHYVMALPLALWAATRPAPRWGILLPALVLVFGLPTFDVFILSWHRLLGLLLLLLADSAVLAGSGARRPDQLT